MRLRITLCILIVNIMAASVVGAVATRALQYESDARARTSTLNQARLISCAIRNIDDEATLLDSMAASTGVSIQLIDQSGAVLYDTRRYNSESTVDVSATAELRDAFANVEGYEQRQAGLAMTAYAALPVEDGRVMRITRSLISEMRDLQTAIRQLWLWLALVIPASLLLGWLIAGRAAKTANVIKNSLNTFGQGDYTVRIPENSGEPELCAEFNSMADQVERKYQTLKKRSHAMSMITSTMQNGILAIDSDMHVVLINPAAKQMLGMVGQVEGMAIRDASKDVNVCDALCAAMQQEGVYTCDIIARTAVGRARRPLRIYASALRDEDATVGALALVEDVTELRRLEQVRTDFVANVSHELKTPLTSIKGFVETLQAGAINKPEMAQKFLNIIMLEADRLTRLINDILSLSKLESGNDKVEMAKLPLNTMASDVCELLRMHAKQKEITVTCNESAPTTLIWGNQDRVRQLLINLIDNAIKYTLNGGSVTVAVYKDADNAYLSVADTGIGIPEEHLPRLYERFYRVDKGRSRSMGGTGLGLAIVKHIVMSMDGHIEVHSKVNEGTEFLITIPLYSGQTDADSNSDENALPGDSIE